MNSKIKNQNSILKRRITKLLAASCCLIMSSVAMASLTPSPTGQGAPTNDEFIGYQWALFNSQQIVKTDLDDIHPRFQKIAAGFSIGWQNFDSLMQKEIVVAIIDSGVDSSHPDLKGHILQGYNFVSSDPRAKNLTDDDVGHGTHLAGILAANSSNQMGISGLSNRIRILPLKVYDRHEQMGSRNKNIPISERVSLAVDYAVAQHADVVLLSMGWPRAVTSEKVKASFKQATEAGLIIVAAAGNDSHNAQIFPCAFEGVICVGSVDIDGSRSQFSNYGGQVDLLAPGQEILSTWPLPIASSRFGPKGYDLRSGTSQAAPLVAGGLAILKGIFPSSSAAQLKAKILLSANQKNQGSRFGLLNIKKAIEIDSNSFIAPVFKQLEVVEIQADQKSFEFPLDFEFIGATKKIEPLIQSQSEGILIKNIIFEGSEGTIAHFRVQGVADSLQRNSQMHLKIKVAERIFEHQINLSMAMDHLPKREYFLSSTGRPINSSELHSLLDFRLGAAARFWSSVQTEQGLKIKVFKPNPSTAVIDQLEVEVPGVSVLQPGFKILGGDWIDSGKDQYLAAFIKNDSKGNPISVHYVYLDENLRILRRFVLDYEGVLPTFSQPSDISIKRVKDQNGGSIKVPVFWDEGLIPKADRDPDPLHFEENIRQQRIYYFEPQKSVHAGFPVLISRCLKFSKIDFMVRSKMALAYSDSVNVLGILKQNQTQKNTGEIQILVSAGRGIGAKLASLNIRENDWTLHSYRLASVDLANQFLQEGWNLLDNGGIDSTNVFQGIFSSIAGRSVAVKAQQDLSFTITDLELPQRGEDIVGIIKTISDNKGQVSFFETTQGLRVAGLWKGNNINSMAPIYRSSFLPGKVFSQLLVPGLVGKNRIPSVVVDNSSLFSRTVSIFSIGHDGVINSKIISNIAIPDECSMMLPTQEVSGRSHMWWFCSNRENFKLIEMAP